MRLWHKDLIPYLPRQQLLGQWRECCLIAKNIAKKGTPNHVLVNRVTEYPIEHFDSYALMIYRDMIDRGINPTWENYAHGREINWIIAGKYIFPYWHNERYLRQCLSNLQEKADCGAIPAEEWKKITDRWPEYK